MTYSSSGCSSSYYYDDYYYDYYCYDYYCYDSYDYYDTCGGSYDQSYDCGDSGYTQGVYLCEGFGGIYDPDDSYLIKSDDCWDVYDGKAYADGYSDGALVTETVAVNGTTSLSFDIKTYNTDPFETADSFSVYAKLDDGSWVLLDKFVIDGNAFVGNITGQSYGESMTTLSYTVGDAGTSAVQFKLVADFSYCDETVVVDNLCIENEGDAQEEECADEVNVTVDFDEVCDPDDEDGVYSDDYWKVKNGEAYADGYNDGALIFDKVEVNGETTVSFDIKTDNINPFETDDNFCVYVMTDGDWVLLDTFRRDGSVFVGDQTGQTYGETTARLSYTVGDDSTTELYFAVVADFSYCDETVRIDNVNFFSAGETCEPCDPGSYEVCIDFNNLHTLTDDAQIASDDHWTVQNGAAYADGYNDGKLLFESQDVNGETTITFDIKTDCVHPFESSDEFKVKVEIDGEWTTLDTFTRQGDVFVGSKTGQTYGESFSTLSYTVGDADTSTVRLKLVADFSYYDETVIVDNVCFKSDADCDTCEDTKETFDGAAAGTVVFDQFDGFTVTAQRAGDSASSENDAMIFDAENPTGGDGDLAFAGKGSILIISEDNDSSDPDDNYNGGTITFDFDNPSKVTSLELLDIEENGGTIEVFDASGTLIKSVAIPATGDNTANTIDIDAEGVSTMVVTLTGSGAVNDLCFEPGEFVDPQTASLGNFVFFDANKNGVFDGADTAVAGVTVELLDDTGAVIGTDTTDANGEYLFDNLAAGDYQVQFTAPTDLEFTTQSGAAADAVNNDSDADATGLTGVVTLDVGEAERDVDAGLVDPGTAAIKGRYFCDDNDNDIDDAEPAIAGATVELLDAAGNVIGTTTTDGNGDYEFTGLDAGTYSVRFAPEATGKVFVAQNDPNGNGDDTTDSDVDPVTGETGPIVLSIGEVSEDNDAGVEDPGTAELGNFVFFDTNKDGVFDAADGDYALADIEVALLDENGATIATQTTNATGNYLFTGLNAGTYQVGFTAAAGLVFTTEGALSSDADGANNDSDADVLTGLTDQIVLSIGESELNIDAGLYVPNIDPVADDETAMTCANETVTVDVLDGDTDADGGTLTITEVDGQAITEGGSVTTTAGTVVSLIGGELVFDGEVAYESLDIGQSTVEAISYTISDGQGGSDIGMVDVTFCGTAETVAEIGASLNNLNVTYQVADFVPNPFDPALLGDFAYDIQISGSGDVRLDDVFFAEAYCLVYNAPVNGSETIDTAPLNGGVLYGTQDDVPLTLLTGTGVNGQSALDNLDIVEWILNQNFTDQGYTGVEVQTAIWAFTDGQTPVDDAAGIFNAFPDLGDSADVQTIIDAALLNGEGYEAGPGGIYAMYLAPSPVTADNSQPFVIGASFDDFDCIC